MVVTVFYDFSYRSEVSLSCGADPEASSQPVPGEVHDDSEGPSYR